MAAAPGGVVHVSLHQYDEAVALDPLPQDADDVIELLSAEAAPISVWLDAAKAFLAQNNVSAGPTFTLQPCRKLQLSHTTPGQNADQGTNQQPSVAGFSKCLGCQGGHCAAAAFLHSQPNPLNCK